MLPSELWPNRNQRLWGSILTVCLSVWSQPASAQGAAAEVTNARVGEAATLPAPVTAYVREFIWYRGTAVTHPQLICRYFVRTSELATGAQYRGREACVPGGYLVIRDVQRNDTGNYTVSVHSNGADPVITTRQLWVYETDLSPTGRPCPTQGSSWQTTLGVACGVLLGAAVIVTVIVVHYERRLKQKDTNKDENVYQNPSFINNHDTKNENMRKGHEGQSANPGLAAESAYMELEHGDRATYDQLKRA